MHIYYVQSLNVQQQLASPIMISVIAHSYARLKCYNMQGQQIKKMQVGVQQYTTQLHPTYLSANRFICVLTHGVEEVVKRPLVELPYKVITYSSIGFSAAAVAPVVFEICNISRWEEGVAWGQKFLNFIFCKSWGFINFLFELACYSYTGLCDIISWN